MPDNDDAAILVALFAREFGDSHRTRLVAGGDEPFYRPAVAEQVAVAASDGAGSWNEIIFRHDYFQSALHELAHWCVAGEARRQVADYGYWYDPDGRTRARQAEFERVEARPQAVEWVLSVACGRSFAVSMDNLDTREPLAADALWRAVEQELRRCVGEQGDFSGMPPRGLQLARAMAARYGIGWPPPRALFGLPTETTPG